MRLHAEATTAFEDETVGDGIRVGFFLNGRRVADVASDEYGMALLDDNMPADAFHDGENELAVRVKGFAREASQALAVEKPNNP